MSFKYLGGVVFGGLSMFFYVTWIFQSNILYSKTPIMDGSQQSKWVFLISLLFFLFHAVYLLTLKFAPNPSGSYVKDNYMGLVHTVYFSFTIFYTYHIVNYPLAAIGVENAGTKAQIITWTFFALQAWILYKLDMNRK